MRNKAKTSRKPRREAHWDFRKHIVPGIPKTRHGRIKWYKKSDYAHIPWRKRWDVLRQIQDAVDALHEAMDAQCMDQARAKAMDFGVRYGSFEVKPVDGEAYEPSCRAMILRSHIDRQVPLFMPDGRVVYHEVVPRSERKETD